jgi:hypothetical protein
MFALTFLRFGKRSRSLMSSSTDSEYSWLSYPKLSSSAGSVSKNSSSYATCQSAFSLRSAEPARRTTASVAALDSGTSMS